jgi:hypothetical protein
MTNWSIRRSSFSVRSLAGWVMMRPSSESSTSASSEVDFVICRAEVLADDAWRSGAPPCGTVRVRELDLVVPGEDADLVLDLVAAVADLTNLVRDPELGRCCRRGP